MLGVVALHDRDAAHEKGDRRGNRSDGGESAKAAVSSPRVLAFVLAELAPRFPERRLIGVQTLVFGEPERGVEAWAAVQVRVAAAARRPPLGRSAQLLEREQVGSFLGDPFAETRPRVQERLMSDGDLIAIDDDQPG